MKLYYTGPHTVGYGKSALRTGDLIPSDFNPEKLEQLKKQGYVSEHPTVHPSRHIRSYTTKIKDLEKELKASGVENDKLAANIKKLRSEFDETTASLKSANAALTKELKECGENLMNDKQTIVTLTANNEDLAKRLEACLKAKKK